jgi:hypothetical protein
MGNFSEVTTSIIDETAPKDTTSRHTALIDTQYMSPWGAVEAVRVREKPTNLKSKLSHVKALTSPL